MGDLWHNILWFILNTPWHRSSEHFSPRGAEHSTHQAQHKLPAHLPVPELGFAEELPGFICVNLQEDLDDVQSKEHPLCIGNVGAFLIQSNEDGIYEDDGIVSPNKSPARTKKDQSTAPNKVKLMQLFQKLFASSLKNSLLISSPQTLELRGVTEEFSFALEV